MEAKPGNASGIRKRTSARSAGGQSDRVGASSGRGRQDEIQTRGGEEAGGGGGGRGVDWRERWGARRKGGGRGEGLTRGRQRIKEITRRSGARELLASLLPLRAVLS